MKIIKFLLLLAMSSLFAMFAHAAGKPKLTLDEFFNYSFYDAIALSPDGRSVVTVVDLPDWDQSIFRTELWLYSDDGRGLIQLTQSGKDSDPEWSPDDRWIAFLSGRKTEGKGNDDDGVTKSDATNTEAAQLFLISPNGGEAIPVTLGDEDVHAFAWSTDSKTLYFATRTAWIKSQKDAHKQEWKDVIQYRGDERGDTIYAISVADAIARRAEIGKIPAKDSDSESGATPGSVSISTTPWRVKELIASPDGHQLAFVSESVSQRQERVSEFEIFTVGLGSVPSAPRQITHNEAVEQNIKWSRDSRHIFFSIEVGSVEGKYLDTQPRLYWVDANSGEIQRWARDFTGAIVHYAVTDNGILATARLETEVQIYAESGPSAPFIQQSGWAGTYDLISIAEHSSKIAALYSAIDKPEEVYLASSVEKLGEAQPATSLNKLFTERDLPRAKPYRWTADDGTPVEGMLMYPPGRFEDRNLPMFVFIHGGPADADGNHFEA